MISLPSESSCSSSSESSKESSWNCRDFISPASENPPSHALWLWSPWRASHPAHRSWSPPPWHQHTSHLRERPSRRCNFGVANGLLLNLIHGQIREFFDGPDTEAAPSPNSIGTKS
jgi:hypothetical protein